MSKTKLVNTPTRPDSPEVKTGSVGALINRAYAIGIIMMLVIAVVAYLWLMKIAAQAVDSHNAETQTQLLQQLHDKLASYLDRVDAVAADPVLADMLTQPMVLATREQELKQSMKASRVLLIVAGQEKQSLGDYPLLTYSELDLIHQTQADSAPGIEFHEVAVGQTHFDIVQGVRRGGRLFGYLVVSFDAAELQRAVASLQISAVRLELNQRLSDGSNALILALGDAALKTDAKAYVGQVAGTPWLLSYWSDRAQWQLQGVSWQWFYLMVLVIVSLLWGLVMRLLQQQLETAVKASGKVFTSYVHDRLNGHWLGKSYNTALVEFEPVLARLQQLNWQSGQTAVVTNSVASEVSESPVDTEIHETSEFGGSYVDLLYQNKEAMLLDESGQDIEETSIENDFADAGVPQAIFRAYDIRGIVGQALTPAVAYQIGLGFGSEAWRQGEQTVVVGRDGRLSSPEIGKALIKGLRASGRDVIDLGLVPTPLVYFATHYLSARSGIMVTGSHNPAAYNGFKMVLRGETLSAEAIQQLYRRIVAKDFASGSGSLSSQDLVADYMGHISGDIKLQRNFKVVLDCGNGAAGEIAPVLLRGLGCQVIELYCDIDGRFPNHHPDPSQPENLADLIAAVKQHRADIGLALDGDGDRLGVVDSHGNILWPDRQLMLYAIDILRTTPGAQIIYDVKCSRHLRRLIEEHGGQPIMWKAGHSMIKARLKETGAQLAGEMSGHIFFNDRWFGFDDGIYAAVRLLELLSKDQRSSYEIFSQLPNALSTPELILAMPEGEHLAFMERLQQQGDFPGAQLIKIDGVRAEYDDAWGLVRASNTSPALTFRFEADDREALRRVMECFRKILLGIDHTLKLPF